MQKSKPWLKKVVLPLVGLALLIVLLLVGVQKAPFDFLASESYRGTFVYTGIPPWQIAAQQYICDPSPTVMAEKAKKELALKGWECKAESNGHFTFTSREGAEIQLSITSGSSFIAWPDLHEKTVVLFYRQPKTIDRIRAWLDRLMSRPSYGPTIPTSITARQPSSPRRRL